MIEIFDFNTVFELLKTYDLIWAIVIAASAFVVAQVFDILFTWYYRNFGEHKQKYYHDLYAAIRRPVINCIRILGLLFALESIEGLNPAGLYIQYAVFVFATLTIAYIIARFLNFALQWYMEEVLPRRHEVSLYYSGIFGRLISIPVYVVAIIIILRYFNVEISPLIASLGIGGLAVALALQDTLANFFSGFYLITDQTVRVGDYVKLEGGQEGTIADISWRTSRIKTPDGVMVIIPNSKMAQSITVNYDQPGKEMSLFFPVYLSLDNDLEHVEKVTIRVVKDVVEKLSLSPDTFTPGVSFKEFNESSLTMIVPLTVNIYTDRFKLRHEFIKSFMKAAKKNKIRLALPVRHVYIRK